MFLSSALMEGRGAHYGAEVFPRAERHLSTSSNDYGAARNSKMVDVRFGSKWWGEFAMSALPPKAEIRTLLEANTVVARQAKGHLSTGEPIISGLPTNPRS
jgi:hypothetical protein